jgi:hypothetical protein
MDSSIKSVKPKKRSKVKRIPPFLLPKGEGIEFIERLKYLSATINQFEWNENNINNKTKKYLPRNGFHLLFWSAIIIDERIKSLIDEIFANNIIYFCDNEFESLFGMSVDSNASITVDQLMANYFLLFSLPAKSHTQYLHEWTKRRLDSWAATLHKQNLCFDSHQELFVETKRRFYVYKELVPALTRFVLNSYETHNRELALTQNPMREMFRQIKIAISYSGLQVFYMSWTFIDFNRKALDLQSVKDDINRITEARNTIVAKYGENILPFARLLNYPEVNQLNRCHYPDLAVCAKYVFSQERTSLANFKFRKIKTKIPVEELERSAATLKPFVFKAFTEEEKAIFFSLGLFPDSETFNALTTFTNPYNNLDFVVNP